MRWFASALGSVMARFLHFFSKGSGSQSTIQVGLVEEGPTTPLHSTVRDRTTSKVAVSFSKQKASKVMVDDTENEFLEGYFNQTDLDLPQEEFTTAMKKLIDAQIVKEVTIAGQTYYQLTSIGRAIGRHRYNSNPKDQN